MSDQKKSTLNSIIGVPDEQIMLVPKGSRKPVCDLTSELYSRSSEEDSIIDTFHRAKIIYVRQRLNEAGVLISMIEYGIEIGIDAFLQTGQINAEFIDAVLDNEDSPNDLADYFSDEECPMLDWIHVEEDF